jgi:hypothetical protein
MPPGAGGGKGIGGALRTALRFGGADFFFVAIRPFISSSVSCNRLSASGPFRGAS